MQTYQELKNHKETKKMQFNQKLLNDLKNSNQDFELYPTTKEMIYTIMDNCCNYDKTRSELGTVLDIGCGTCNFKKYAQQYIDEHNTKESHKPKAMTEYYVIEKSQILINQLDKDTVVLGTDFNKTTLIDKPVDTIFCNPPYSEFEAWTIKILKEAPVKYIYMVIPERWKKSAAIQEAIDKYTCKEFFSRWSHSIVKVEPKILGTFNFMDAERQARAKVDIVKFDKSEICKDKAFKTFFDENFPMEIKSDFNFETINNELKNELATGKDKIEILVNGYNNSLNNLLSNFKALSSMDSGLLEQIGISKDSVQKSLKEKIENLKNLYWEATINCLKDITSRLTYESRQNLLQRFAMAKSAEFTAEGIYALLCWVIKNANDYTTEQMLNFFFSISNEKTVKMYKSNEKLFCHEQYKYYRREIDKYTLDYRIITETYHLPKGRDPYWRDNLKEKHEDNINNVCVIANNLGFPHGQIVWPEDYGKKGIVYMQDNKTVLFEFKIYLNRNVHLKFNVEFMKAFNVAVGQALGWIRNKEDIQREFTPEMAKGAEKYLDCKFQIELNSIAALGFTA